MYREEVSLEPESLAENDPFSAHFEPFSCNGDDDTVINLNYSPFL